MSDVGGDGAVSVARRRTRSGWDGELFGALVYGGSLAITTLVAYLFNALLGRRLGPVDFGTFGALLAVMLAFAGPSTALFGGAAMSAARTGRIPRARWLGWIALAGAAATVVAVLPTPHPAQAVSWFIVASAMWFLISWNRGLLIGFGRLSVVGGTIVLEGVARLGFAILLVARGWGVAGASGGMALGMITAAAVTWALLPRGREGERPPIAEDVWLAIMGLFFLGLVQFPDVISVRLFNPGATGQYTAASSIARMVVYAQAPAAVYALRRAAVVGPREALKRALPLALVPGLLLAAALEVFPQRALSLTYAGRYVAGAGLVRVLVAAMLMSGLTGAMLNMAIGAGRTGWAWTVAAASTIGTVAVFAMAGHTTSTATAVLIVQAVLLVLVILHVIRIVGTDRRPDGSVVFLNWRDTRHPDGGGSEVFVEEMAKRLAAAGRRVTVFCADHGRAAREEVRDGVRFLRRGSWRSVYLWAAVYHLTGRFGPHDTVVDVQNAIPFFSSLYCGRRVIALVHHVHREQWRMLFGRRVARLGWWVESRLAPRLYARAMYVVVSQATKADLVALGVDADRISIVHNGASSPTVDTLPKAAVPTLVYLGRLVPHKRIELLLDATARLRHEFPGLRVRLIGRGQWEHQLRLRVGELKLGDIVSFEGYVDEASKQRMLSEAWVHVLPSVKEGWGLAVVEAAAAGTPSIAFRVGGLQESIVDGETGILSDTFEEFATGLTSLLASASLRDRLGSAGLARTRLFNWDASAAAFAAAVDGVPLQAEPEGLLVLAPVVEPG